MANNCLIDVNIKLNNSSDKKTLFDILDKDFCKANKNHEGCYVGSDEKYLFDAEAYDNTDKEVVIVAWVKWGMTDNEMVSFFKYLNRICFIQELTVKLYESGNGVCEEYKYHYEKENELKHKVLDCTTVLNYVAEEIAKDEHSAMYNCFDELEKVEGKVITFVAD
jgi:hypothetical protein